MNMSSDATSTISDAQAAGNKFLALNSGNLAAYMESCVRCGQCATACHFYEVTGDPKYTPAYKLFPMAKAHKRTKWPWRWFGGPTVTEADLQEWEELLYDSCTMCGRCTQVCPMGIDIASIVAASRQAFAAAGRGPKDLFEAAENVREEDDYEVDLPIDKKGADVLLTVSSIELMKYPKSIVAMARLLNQAGVNWTFSSHGYEATNFGFLAGKSDISKLAIERIVNAAEELGTKLLVIPECGHAFGVLRWSGANILGRPLPFHVMHIPRPLPDLTPRRCDCRCQIPVGRHGRRFSRNDPDRQFQLVLRWWRRRAGHGPGYRSAPQGFPDQDETGGRYRRRYADLGLRQLPPDHGRQQGLLEVGSRPGKPG
jgi:ferredoxin